MELQIKDWGKVTLPDSKKAAARFLADMIRLKGRNPDEPDNDDARVPWDKFAATISPANRDTVRTSEILPLLSSSMEILMREPVEPLLVINSLFDRVEAKGLETRVLGGAIGAVYAADVAEGGAYPEVHFQLGGALETVNIGKSGLQASFSDESLRYSTWDMLGLNLRLMGAALARHKEQKAIRMLRGMGTVLYDNMVPADSLFGVCTGRALDMAGNGSLTAEDIFRAYAHMAEEGFPPDVLVMNPLYFLKYLLDPVLRTMMLNWGGGSMFNMYQGNPGPRDPWSNGAMGAQGPSTGHRIVPGGTPSGETPTPLTGRSNQANSAPVLPGYFPVPMRIMTSPLLPFDPETQIGDIFLCSSGNVGSLLVDEEPTTIEWRDENAEVTKVKMRERYVHAVRNEGQGVAVFKNVPATRNYWDGQIVASVGDVDALPAGTAVI